MKAMLVLGVCVCEGGAVGGGGGGGVEGGIKSQTLSLDGE